MDRRQRKVSDDPVARGRRRRGDRRSNVRIPIGECLVRAGLIDNDDLTAALAEPRRSGERLGSVLVRLELASETQVTRALGYQLGFPYVNPAEEPPEPATIEVIPKDVAIQRVCVALKREQGELTVAMADPLVFSVVRDLEFLTGCRIRQVIARKVDILTAIHAGYRDRALAPIGDDGSRSAVMSGALGNGGGADSGVAGAVTPAEGHSPVKSDALAEGRGHQAPVVDLVDRIFARAVTGRASDIHLEPTETRVIVRHRIDGILSELIALPKWNHEGLVARMKILADMDVAEKRRPQDGRHRVRVDDKQVDVRVSTLRTMYGEKIVLRILDQRKGPPPLTELGLSSGGLETLRQLLRRQHGVILVVGPTGSGKTTTLSSAIASLPTTRTNIITIEDPIEYQLPGVNQTQVSDKIDLTFASSLRAILRQDPDVILVGEIRDLETAQIALRAAQTGHLVLSTLHTDDSPSTLTRLMDMGTEAHVIGSALIGVVAQRLVRRLCVRCRVRDTPTPDALRSLNIATADADRHSFYRANGCDRCGHTGYRGRVAIFEIMPVSDRLRRLIAGNKGEDAIRDEAMTAGMTRLGADGLAKFKSGVTTAEELLRVVPEVSDVRSVCPSCEGAVETGFQVCPRCGCQLAPGCPSCHRALQPGWHFCPHCATTVTGSTPNASGTTPNEKTALPAGRVLDVSTFHHAGASPGRKRSGLERSS